MTFTPKEKKAITERNNQLMNNIKEGLYHSILIYWPQNNTIEQIYGDVLRFALNNIGSLNTRCILGCEEAKTSAGISLGKKSPFVKMKVAAEELKGPLNDDYSIILLLEPKLKTLDESFLLNGCVDSVVQPIDCEAANLIMKAWHYQSPLEKIMSQVNDFVKKWVSDYVGIAKEYTNWALTKESNPIKIKTKTDILMTRKEMIIRSDNDLTFIDPLFYEQLKKVMGPKHKKY